MLCGKRKTEGPGEKFRSKDENQQQIQPTCEDRTQATALSPLHHKISHTTSVSAHYTSGEKVRIYFPRSIFMSTS